MAAFARVRLVMLSGVACSILAACGADGVASPGEGVIVIPTPTADADPHADADPAGHGDAGRQLPDHQLAPDQLANLGTISRSRRRMAQLWLPDALHRNDRDPQGCRRHLFASRPRRCRQPIRADRGARTMLPMTLTIDPGVTVFGATGTFLPRRQSRQHASTRFGTATQPIVFTGRGNVIRFARSSTRTSQLWAASSCLAARRSPTATRTGRRRRVPLPANARPKARRTPSTAARTPADNSGRMSLCPDPLLGLRRSATASNCRGLTPSGTRQLARTLDHIQIHNSSDDGIEVFGGRVNMKHLVDHRSRG